MIEQLHQLNKLNMEEIWKHTKPFSYPLKGTNGCAGYGYRSIKRKPQQRVQKRRIGRDIRHYGFDTTECWELYTTIMQWMSDNVGGFFRECGSADDWYLYDIEGNEYPDGIYSEANPFFDTEENRKKSYKEHLEEYLATSNKYSKFVEFVIPRLIYFIKHHQGYPALLDSEEEWKEILKVMIKDLVKSDTKLFIKYFFCLWD